MWHLRCLTGPLAGKSLPLKPGRNVVGRAPHCEVMIPSQNISKEHATIEVYNDKIILTDLNSRNGTFVDGVQIKSQKIRAGERIGLFDIIVEVVKKSAKTEPARPLSTRKQPHPSHPTHYQGNVAYDQFAQPEHSPNQTPAAGPAPSGFADYVNNYIDNVVLPGVYKLLEWFEFRLVVGIFVIGFVVLVTTLSAVPLTRILKASVEQEAQNRAVTIAKLLVRDNQLALAQGQTSLVTVDNAMNEPGVSKAYVISSMNRDILAPPAFAGQYLTDIPFVNEAAKTTQIQAKQIDDSTVVAVAPILYNNPNTGQMSALAHSVVVYNMGALAVDNKRTLSLFIQVLAIALMFGFLLYFFLYKIIEHPIRQLNSQLNTALRDTRSQISTPFLFPELQQLATNINSAVSRSGQGFGSESLKNFEADRTQEMQALVNLIGFAAITISPADKRITAVNSHFETQLGAGQHWVGLTLDQILDQALKLNLQGLVDRVVADPTQTTHDQLEITNQQYELSAHGVMGSQTLSYIIVAFIPKMGGS